MDTVTCDECNVTRSRDLVTGWREVVRMKSGAERLHFCSLLCEEVWCGRRREENGEAAPASATTATQHERWQEVAREFLRVPPLIGHNRADHDNQDHGWHISARFETEDEADGVSLHIPEGTAPWRPEDHEASNWRRKEAAAESGDVVDCRITGELITEVDRRKAGVDEAFGQASDAVARWAESSGDVAGAEVVDE